MQRRSGAPTDSSFGTGPSQSSFPSILKRNRVWAEAPPETLMEEDHVARQGMPMALPGHPPGAGYATVTVGACLQANRRLVVSFGGDIFPCDTASGPRSAGGPASCGGRLQHGRRRALSPIRHNRLPTVLVSAGGVHNPRPARLAKKERAVVLQPRLPHRAQRSGAGEKALLVRAKRSFASSAPPATGLGARASRAASADRDAAVGVTSLGPFLFTQERTSRRARERAQHPRRQPKTADSAAPAQGPRQRSSTGTSSPFACKQAPTTCYPQTDPTPNTSAATISASTSPNQGFAICGWSDQAPRL